MFIFLLPKLEAGTAPIDPQILNDLEIRAQLVAANLSQVMDNLRNSLHAVSSVVQHYDSIQLIKVKVCPHQRSIEFLSPHQRVSEFLSPV